MCYRDTTFCVSPNCENKCRRKLTDADRDGAKRSGLPLSMGYFCDKPEWAKGTDATFTAHYDKPKNDSAAPGGST